MADAAHTVAACHAIRLWKQDERQGGKGEDDDNGLCASHLVLRRLTTSRLSGYHNLHQLKEYAKDPVMDWRKAWLREDGLRLKKVSR